MFEPSALIKESNSIFVTSHNATDATDLSFPAFGKVGIRTLKMQFQFEICTIGVWFLQKRANAIHQQNDM